MADDVLREILEVLACLAQLAFYPLNFLAVLVNVEERDEADAHLQQTIHVGVGEFADQLLSERLETLMHRSQDRFVSLALLDLFVEAFLDEDALQRAEMQLVLELGFLKLEFAL